MSMKKDSMAMKSGMMHDALMGPSGSFTGANKHSVTGGYSIDMAGGNATVKLNSDFKLDQAPDPFVVLSPTDKGDAAGALNLGRLKSNSGAQTFAVPAGTNLASFTHVLVYCKKYNVTLGWADLATMMKDDGMMKHDTGMMKHDSAMSH
ncbi:MAG: DM13 domain-containing protein [Gemmatimonadota bacterium]